MTLRIKLDDNPYSLSQDELMALQNNDRLISTMDYLLKDALIKKAMVQVRNWQVLASNQPTQATAL